MIILLLSGLTYAALVLDTGSGSWSLPAGTMPQFLFLAAAVALLTCRGGGAILWAVVTGLLADVVQGGPLGLHVVLLANLTIGLQMLGARKWRESAITSAALVLVYVACAGLAGAAVSEVLAARPPDLRTLSITALSRAGGTAFLYLLLVGISRTIARAARLILPKPKIAGNRPGWAQ